MNCILSENIYLLQEREFVNNKENVFKIGRSKQENTKRLIQYPKGSKLLLSIACSDCKKIENILIKNFKIKYKHRKEHIGSEYFEGDYKMMMKNIIELTMNENDNKNVDIDNKNIYNEDIDNENIVIDNKNADDKSIDTENTDKHLNDENICDACGGNGVSYWSDGIYSNCIECCCIDCGRDCKCTTCDKCGYRVSPHDKKCECDKCTLCGVYSVLNINKHCFSCKQENTNTTNKNIDDKNIDDKNIDDKNIDGKNIDDKNIDSKNIDDIIDNKKTFNIGTCNIFYNMTKKHKYKFIISSLDIDFF